MGNVFFFFLKKDPFESTCLASSLKRQEIQERDGLRFEFKKEQFTML